MSVDEVYSDEPGHSLLRATVSQASNLEEDDCE